ncbi:MAG: PQQ-binding-like beta-propeller repeat protein [Bacteroidota bacterium]|nr:PQQ-binding-like beta-propeller repeat protein [Bacteroidota bacterium]
MKRFNLIVFIFPFLFYSCFPLSIDKLIEVDQNEDWLYIGGDLAKSNISKSKIQFKPPFTLYWQFDADGGLAKNCLSVSDAILFAATLNGEAYAIDLLSGKSLGRINAIGKASFSTPVVFNNNVIIASSGNKGSTIFSYSLVRGAIKWQKNVGWIESSPVLDGETIFVSSINGRLHKINARTGSILWTRKPSGKNNYLNVFRTSPTIIGNKVLLGGSNSNMYAFDSLSGKELWKFKTDGSIFCDASADNGKIYFGSDDKNFYCIDTSGTLVWKNNLKTKFEASSTFFEDMVITAGVDGNVYGMNKNTGNVIWTFVTKGSISASPLLQENKIFIGSFDKNFYCLDASTGKQLWKFESEGRIRTSAVIWKDYIFVAGDDKYIYCFSNKAIIKSSSGGNPE